MRKRLIMIVSGGSAALIVFAACLLLIQSGRSRREMLSTQPQPLREMAVAEPAAAPAELESRSPGDATGSSASYVPGALSSASNAPETTASTVPIEVSVPQLAYAYVLGYRLPGPRIGEAQQAHLALCQRLGTAQCQLISMRQGSSDDGYANANLLLRVASSVAQRFRADLTKAIAAEGGRAAETTITADDVSKDVVDTEARIRQREILVTRLTDMLRNRQGRVSELVEAERSVAIAQEELDQAKGWLPELRTRVALSRFTINYVPAVAVEPSSRAQSGRLGDAIVASAAMVYAFTRNLLIVLIFLAPWALIAVAGWLAVRRWYKPRLAPVVEA